MEELFKDYGKVIIRTPLYSYLNLFDSNNETRNLEELVRLRLEDTVFMEALYWSSPQLFEAVLKFKRGNIKGAKESKLMHTLKKYLIRANTRCTPYGIYAGTSVAYIGNDEVERKGEMERKVRIDMGLMQNIKSQIETDPAISTHLLYTVNNSFYSIPGQYRFIETIIENGKYHYQLSSIEHTEFLEKIIASGKNRMVSLSDIYDLAEKEIPYEEFDEFIKELIQMQFLISELQLGLTIGNELERYVSIVKRLAETGITEAQKYVNLFSSLENILSQFQKLPIGVLPLQEIKALKVLLNKCGIEGVQEHIFHADLKQSIPDGFVFTNEQVKEIEKAVVILGKLSSNTSPLEVEMERFKKLFQEKYETREIPLAEALDPEFGIGFPAKDRIGDTAFNSIIEKVEIQVENKPKIGSENGQAWLREKIESLDSLSLKSTIQITEEELKDFDDKVLKLSDDFSVMGSLLPSGKILLESAGGSHANSLMARFAYLEETIADLSKELSDTEKQTNQDVIFAEIIFIPEGRIGNIARRPVLSDHEIPLLSCSGVKGEKQIPVNDLLLSIQDNEIVLRSQKLNKRIIPRLSNAHNYINSEVPVYQFLSAVQHQGKHGFYISWGDLVDKRRFFPRIVYRNIILHRACWFLGKRDISRILKANDPLGELTVLFVKWNVGRFVSLVEGDNELFIDCSNNTYLELLLEEIKTRKSVKLVEWLYDSFGKQKNIQQFILPLSKKTQNILRPLKRPKAINCLQRTFEPGSEWIYFKIYCGSTFSDRILLDVVKPAINSLLEENIIAEAFFVRYIDPHYHIRFRLHLINSTNKEHLESAMKCVYDLLHPLCTNRLVWKVQLDTYQREIERYGAGIITSEAIFSHDSLLFLNCLLHPEFVEDEQIRFLAAIKNMDKWLTVFKISQEEKADYCKKMCNAFANEFDNAIKLQLDLEYREFKNVLPSFLNSDEYETEFNKRDKPLEKALIPKENWADYIHMSMNRWFITRQRLMEYMCYLFCSKYYSQLLYCKQKAAKIS